MSGSLLSLLQPRFLYIGGSSRRFLQPILSTLQVRNPLVVTDKFLLEAGLVDRVLNHEGTTIKAPIFSECIPDPTTNSVQKLVDAIKDGNHPVDGLIAIGGGSPIDTAKAASIMAKHSGALREYKAPFQMEIPGIPVIAIPTTAGTGSEVTKFTVVTDSDTGEKMLCVGSAYVPAAAIVDYELTMEKPWRLTADTAIDSLTHAIEAFVSRKRNPFTDPLCLSAMESIARNVSVACKNPDDKFAREALMLAATQAGLAFSNSSVALVHAMSRPLGAHFHIPHGLSNAMLLPKVTQFSIPGARELYAVIARTIGAASYDDSDTTACANLVLGLQALNWVLKVPSLKKYGIIESEFKQSIPIMAQQAIASGSHANNPKIPTQDEIEDLYEEIYDDSENDEPEFSRTTF